MSHSALSPLIIQTNPCVHCGACCAYFRVSFYWAEADDGGGCVPANATEKLSPFLRCMQGTNARHPRCIYLLGEVGRAVSCSAYPQRPSPCREFSRSWEDGKPNAACDRARAAYGLPPLSPSGDEPDKAAEEIATRPVAGCHSGS